ncbi:amino acid adenylation domain-containing protein [Pseudoalteromonas sp. MMG013]|uniref:non-ribosomal peptide synthetase n=1 Tax=Pseudoalteromonas sp. MMG013 TaxID=2822687 RepID=UPI001B36099C|nr:non-ribosomal peptide synthetase [Pseudoalteromonas sp. MMG013]MBQ4862217.1 amino acid adenylation domain-containing protein [Pseudoalteromonas sp. MMG013]
MHTDDTPCAYVPTTIYDYVSLHAIATPSTLAYEFVKDNGQVELLNYAQLNNNIKNIAQFLSERTQKGDRVVLMFQPGLEFIQAFFACLYVGLVAVPVYPPSGRKEDWMKLSTIAKDSGASMFVLDKHNQEQANKWLSEESWFVNRNFDIDEGLRTDWVDVQAVQSSLNELAFLQYTSGSTGDPKGVMVSHGNLLANQQFIKEKFAHDSSTTVAGWLPQYHDMGLIGNILQPIYLGTSAVLMSPAAFLQNPIRWLELISSRKISTSGGPNFAYQVCAERITEQQKQSLDLSSWKVAFNGAEPINPKTLALFSEAFAECGFSPRAFYPCYGLAESTLLTTGGEASALPIEVTVCVNALKNNQAVEVSSDSPDAVTVVGCGSILDSEACVVNYQTQQLCTEGSVGEIWLRGDSTTLGYWNRSELNEQAYNAKLAESSEAYMRTGDLGFVLRGQLFITGRLKDLIIIRGKNYYPQDIEFAVQQAVRELNISSGACFSVNIDGTEQLVLVNEIKRTELRKLDKEACVQRIKLAIRRACGLSLHDVVLTRPNRVLKTSSGKIRRRECKKRYLADDIEYIYRDRQSSVESVSEQVPANQDQSDILQRIISILAQVLDISPKALDHTMSISSLGVDSITAVQLQGQFEKQLGLSLQLTDILYGITIQECEQMLINQPQRVHSKQVQLFDKVHQLTDSQLNFWKLQHIHEQEGIYNISVPFEINTGIDPTRLRNAVAALLKRHRILNATYPEVDGQPVERIIDDHLPLTVTDATTWDEDALKSTVREEARKPFNLACEPVLRIHCFLNSNHSSLLHCVLHHIAGDFWSVLVLIKELLELYENAGLESNTIQYNELMLSQEHWHDQGLPNATDFPIWTSKVGGKLNSVPLPVDFARPANFNFQGKTAHFKLEDIDLVAINTYCQTKGTTFFNYLLAIFQLLMHKYTHADKFVLGTPVSRRQGVESENVIGCFVDVKLVPFNYEAEQTFTAYVAELTALMKELLTHRHVTTSRMMESFCEPLDRSADQLFPNVRFVLHKAHTLKGAEAFVSGRGNLQFGNFNLCPYPLENDMAQTDLLFTVCEVDGQLNVSINYNTSLFSKERIEMLATLYQSMLNYCTSNINVKLSEVPLLSSDFHNVVEPALESGQQRTHDVQGVHQLFEQQAVANPMQIAVQQEQQQISYGCLNDKANQLSHYLIAQGVCKGDILALYFPRDIDMVVAFLAVLKAGATALFFDPSIPMERRKYMLSTCKPTCVLTNDQVLEWASEYRQISVGELSLSQYSCDNVNSKICDEDVAYLLFTSGSTGQPKAVKGLHRGLINRTVWMRDEFSLTVEDKLLHCTPMNYVRGERELIFALSCGATLTFANAQALNQPKLLLDAIVQRGVTFTASSPSLLEMILRTHGDIFRTITTLKHWFIGADVLKGELVKSIQQHQPSLQLTYFYGSTEISSDVSYFKVPQEYVPQNANVQVGQPLYNTQLLITDAEGKHPLPRGVLGELYVSGANLSGGYFMAEELTREQFVQLACGGSQTWYRTGDMAMIDMNGDLRVIGRAGTQVNIRGHRIDIAEVEASLLSHPDIVQAVVKVDILANEEMALVGYVVANKVNIELELKQFLQQLLPNYMQPAFIVRVDEMPVTELGKIDRSKLPKVSSVGDLKRQVEKPSNHYEQLLLRVWAQVNQVEESAVDVNDGFFELGGNSVLLTKMYARLQQELSDKSIALTDLYKHSSIRKLAAHLASEVQIDQNSAAQSRADKRKNSLRRINKGKR